ncbi:MAG: hypothetical protein V3573_14435 [Desulfovibrionaceae bacterium]
MASITSVVGARSTLTTTLINSLAPGAYVAAGTINHATNDPLDVLVEVRIMPGTVAGDKVVLVFAKGSLDGTNFTSGPESGTTETDENNLVFLGSIPCNTNAAEQAGIFSLAAAFGGALPQASKIILKNDTGAALASSGNAVYFAEVSGASA